MENRIVSVIVPTKDSSGTLEECLRSIRMQTYSSIELIVVDNYSADATVDVAKRFADKVILAGPERSAQRNRGADAAAGDFMLMIDSDMELGEKVVAECVAVAQSDSSVVGVVIPEESFGSGFWSECKRLERSFYVGVPWIEAARFFRGAAYKASGGYDEALVSGEDWDLSKRIAMLGDLSRVDEYIRHNEGHISLRRTTQKKFYYARHMRVYLARNPEAAKWSASVGPLARYRLFLSDPKRLFGKPVVGLAMLFMKTCEFASGALGYVLSYLSVQ